MRPRSLNYLLSLVFFFFFLLVTVLGLFSIERLSKFPAGFSWITYSVTVAGFAKAREVILRIGPPYGLPRRLGHAGSQPGE